MTKDYAKNRSRPLSKRHPRYYSHSASNGLPSWAWMLIGLFFGIAFSTFMYWKLHKSVHLASNPRINASEAAASKLSQSPLAKANQSSPKAKKNKTTEHNALSSGLTPADSVSTPPQSAPHHAPASQRAFKMSDLKDLRELPDTQKPTNNNPESRFDFYTLLPTTNTESVHETPGHKSGSTPYILQAGSFKTHQQAERLKATLALQGLEAHIQTVTINAAESWYRVYIGPFTTKAQALEAQQHLENGLDSGMPPTLNSVILKMKV